MGALIIAFVGLLFVAGGIYFLPPNVWTEIPILLIFIISIYEFCKWVTKSKKYTILITLLIAGILFLNRFSTLNIITGGLLAAILGLIALNS